MKKIVSIGVVLFLCMVSNVQAQTRITVSRSAAFPDSKGDSLHKIANEFADRVGEVLKEDFPLTIDSSSLSVKIECFNDTVKLTYFVALERCDTASALYYFDHRGALSKGTISYTTEEDAEIRCLDQAVLVIGAFKKAYGNNMFNRFIDVHTKCNNGYIYALSEFFIASKRK